MAQSSKRAGTAQGLTLVGAIFLTVLAVIALPPALPRMMAYFNDNPNVAMLTPVVVAVPGLVVALLSPLVGWISDRYGKRNPILIGMVIYLVAGLAPFYINDLNLLIASRVVLGVGVTLVTVIATSLLADYFPEEERRTWLTVQGLVLPIAAALVLFASGALAGSDWHRAFLLYALAAPVLVAALFFCFEPDTQAHAQQNAETSAPFPWPAVIRVCFVAWLIAVFFYAFIIFSGLAFASIGVREGAALGGVLAGVSLATMLGALGFNALSRRASPILISAIQVALMGAGLIGMGLSTNLVSMIVFAAVQQIGAGMMVATTLFWMSQVLPPEHRGQGFGLLATIGFLGQFMTPFIVTFAGAVSGGLRPGLAALGAAGVVCSIGLMLLARGGARGAA